MRILQFDTGRVWRGGQQQVAYLLEGLIGHGIATVLAAPPGSALWRWATEKNIPALPLPVRGDLDVWAARRLARRLAGEPFDLLHCHTAHALGVAIWAVRWLRRPPVLVATQRTDFAGGWLRRWKLHQCACVIGVSQAVIRRLQKSGLAAEQLAYVSDGVDTDRFAPPPDRAALRNQIRKELQLPLDAPVAVSAGYLSTEKGHCDLLTAAELLRRRWPQAWFVVAGQGPLQPLLEQRTARADLPVKFVGFWPPPDVPRLFAAADVFVLPSRSEALGSVLLEAMACGLPVVATRVGGVPEVIEPGQTGLLVPVRCPAELAEAIGSLFADPEAARQLGQRARRYVVEHRSSRRMVEQTLRIYERLLVGTRSTTTARAAASLKNGQLPSVES